MLQQQHSGTSLIIGRTSTGLSAVAQSYSQIISTCPRCTSSPLDAFAAPHSLTLRLRPPSMLRALAGKGGKNRRRGKNDGEETKRELEYKEFGQEYAQVVRMLGNGRCECYCYDGVTRLGHIRGKMRKKVCPYCTHARCDACVDGTPKLQLLCRYWQQGCVISAVRCAVSRQLPIMALGLWSHNKCHTKCHE
eukprot:TRINITY_DN1057_c0_g1_i4.p1 TRINITY_DN1057_c0_g1~~TRINITY_DN1057_c0_g1_i4.p1  ORF type:complete len:192 (-),score=9.41 TRINITY_DN1057_c0_g1_i4:777-1352(-)